MAPAKPLPLDTAMASTSSPADSMSAVSCWPTSYSDASSTRSSTSLRPGSTPGIVEVALLRLGQGGGAAVSPGHLQRRVALAFWGLDLHDPDRRHAHHRHRYRPVLVVPDLGHSHFFAHDRLGGHWSFSVSILHFARHRPTWIGGCTVRPALRPAPRASRRFRSATDCTQTLRSEEPERSARLVWSEVPAELPRALRHVLLTIV